MLTVTCMEINASKLHLPSGYMCIVIEMNAS